MLKGPTFRFRVGRVVEIEHESGRFGYLVGRYRKPRYGSFFTLITRTYDTAVAEPLLYQLQDAPNTTVRLNTYNLLSTIGPFIFRHKGDLPDYSAPELPTWGGDAIVDYRNSPRPPNGTAVTVWHPDGTEERRRGQFSLREWEEQMEREGIILSTLWLPKSIGEFLFDGRPLRWSVHKKY